MQRHSEPLADMVTNGQVSVKTAATVSTLPPKKLATLVARGSEAVQAKADSTQPMRRGQLVPIPADNPPCDCRAKFLKIATDWYCSGKTSDADILKFITAAFGPKP